MFMRVAFCGKFALVTGIIFIIMGGISVYQEITSGMFNVKESPGIVSACAGIGLLFFYWMRVLDVRAGNSASCGVK